MANLNGFQCGRNNFWRLLRNPIYCGIIIVPATKSEEIQFVKGIHEPIISKLIFDTVQQIFASRRQPKNVRGCRISLFPLRGFFKSSLV
jgi:site-specific DNA recombinase